MELKQKLAEMDASVHDAFNCTLWNWNQGRREYFCRRIWLLIVPYGIETIFRVLLAALHLLLIVPYGIETNYIKAEEEAKKLLIVPYGIETLWIKETQLILIILLIVPYGIETVWFIPFALVVGAFNCTLWNWNKDIDKAVISPLNF